MFTVAILVSSDRAYKGIYEDKSGALLKTTLIELGYDVKNLSILPDDFGMLKSKINQYIEEDINLVLTCGGTGFSPRDIIPEVTKSIIERETPGISEAIRNKSLEITPKAMLSRATSGIKNKTLIINLPGSTKGAKESLDIILPALNHGLGILLGIEDN
ncbi:MAG: MogA/MoaB family molybdenum cofactor biosynthesis protein [Clostridia bacterium]|nr:MogA/MoaB family molybdenum cofactor biosynthesis protein [Clostridia bacterium]